MIVTEKEAFNSWCPLTFNKVPEPCRGKACMAFTVHHVVLKRVQESPTSAISKDYQTNYYYCGLTNEKHD